MSNVIKQLNSVGSSLQGGLDSYNAQKEASEQLDAVTKTTGEYAESYNRFKNAMDSLIEHKKTERPENEKEAAQWDEQLKNLLQEANPSNLDAEAIAGIIAGYTLKKEYPEIEEAYLEFQKAAEANSRLAERIDVNHVTEAQMQEAEALAAQWEALESKYGSYFQIYENEIQKWAGVDWRPQIIETVFLSNPVSRVEKTSDTLYIYVPTGTRYTKAIMDFISYSGKSESIDATDMVMKGKKNNLSQPIYEWDMSSNMIGSFKIEYREDK